MPDLGDSLNLPYELNPPDQPGVLADQADVRISGGVVVAGAMLPVGDEAKPAIMWRFAAPTGEFYLPILLVLDAGQAVALSKLVSAAVESAVKAADRANRRGRDA